MEFWKYHWLDGEREDRLMPRIGTLAVLEPLTEAEYLAPCPLDDRWGSAQPAEYPAYGVFSDEGGFPRLVSFFSLIEAKDREGKPFRPSFQPYGYRLPDYLRPEGAELWGGKVSIRLNPPFRLSPDGKLEGYDPSWLKSSS